MGCAIVQSETGEEVRRVCRPFDYSGKTILSIDDFEKQMQVEFKRVRSLSNKTKNWITVRRDPQDLFTTDALSVLNKVGKKTQDKLKEAGVSNVGDMKKIAKENLKQIQGLSEKTLTFIWTQCQLARDDIPPEDVDHRKAPNPYLSKYGEQWIEKLKASPSFSSYVCITDYVEFIVAESSRIMSNTKHSEDWVFYHDALSLMTAKKTKEWMRSKGYYKKWLLPTKNLYDNSPDLLKRYKDNPIGNSPEFMPWDSHLNQDLHAAHDHHVTLTRHLPDDDPRKFDGSTPKRMASSYTRLLSITPTSQRVREDCSRVLHAFQAVYDLKGAILEGEYGERSGRRLVSKSDEESSKRGGSREKKEYKRHNNLHPLVNSFKKRIYEASTMTYEGSGCNGGEDTIIGVDVQGRFDGDSASLDVSDL